MAGQNRPSPEMRGILAFPPQVMAEQLTWMDLVSTGCGEQLDTLT